MLRDHVRPNASTVRSVAARPRRIVRARGRSVRRRAPDLLARVCGCGGRRAAAERDRPRGVARLSALPLPRARPARARARPSAARLERGRRRRSRFPRRSTRASRSRPTFAARGSRALPRANSGRLSWRLSTRRSPTPSCAAIARAPRSRSMPTTPRAPRSSCGSRRSGCRPSAKPCSTGCARTERSPTSSSSNACARCSRTVSAAFARTIARDLPAQRAAPLQQWADFLEKPEPTIDAFLQDPANRRAGDAALLAGWTKLARSAPLDARERYEQVAALVGPGARRRLCARTRARPRVGPTRARGARRVREASGSAARRQRARVASARRALGARLGASRALDPRNVGRAARRRPAGSTGPRARPPRAMTARAPRRSTRRSCRATTITRPMPRYGSAASPSPIRNGSR